MTRSTITRRALFASLAALPFLGRRTEASVIVRRIVYDGPVNDDGTPVRRWPTRAPVEVVNGQGKTGILVPETVGELKPIDYCAEGVEYAPFQAIGGTVAANRGTIVSLSEDWAVNQWMHGPIHLTWLSLGDTADWPEGGAG